jgi:trans-aconitate 2-methyltransferase
MPMPWDPDTYRKFESERFAPFEDLVALIEPRDSMTAVDLGCGTGELTARLADGLPGSDVLGIDSSAEMLDKARPLARPGLRFEQHPIEAVEGRWDLVFSHAALQWVDGHLELIPRLFAMVKPGGQLAVQVPSNHTHPTHLLIRETAGESPFVEALGGWTRQAPVLGIDAYAALLYACDAERITVFEKVYPHVLEDADAMVQWVSGTALVPYMERLPAELREPFMDAYRAKVRAHFPERPAFYPFKRTLFAAHKAV